MVSFIKGDENVFRGKSKLPPTFAKGVIINTAYVVILMLLSYWAFVYSLFRMTGKEIETVNGAKIVLNDGKYSVWYTRGDNFKRMIFNLLSGNLKMLEKKGFTEPVTVNKANIAKEKYAGKFVFICNPAEIPGDLKVRKFIRSYASSLKLPGKEAETIMEMSEIKNLLGKRFRELDENERFYVLWALLHLNHKSLYIIDSIVDDLPFEFSFIIKKQMEKMIENGSIVLFLTAPVKGTGNVILGGKFFQEGDEWSDYLKAEELKAKYKSKVVKE
jgi:hypothetical protein